MKRAGLKKPPVMWPAPPTTTTIARPAAWHRIPERHKGCEKGSGGPAAFGHLPRTDGKRGVVAEARLGDCHGVDGGHQHERSEHLEHEHRATYAVGQRPVAAGRNKVWHLVFSPVVEACCVQVFIKINESGEKGRGNGARYLRDSVEPSLERRQNTSQAEPRRHRRIQVSARILCGHEDAHREDHAVDGTNLLGTTEELEDEGPEEFSPEGNDELAAQIEGDLHGTGFST
ncbi:hypothetical protein Ctob_004910 [Chrysochromulina tobinii]|uniref:Uncharacterized protein n=1 Tax=Chrysochromulina tobinii TaxID=1460289 RepID=A0A0M0JC18_9EUKA|nr:hypothetical protein Ctob_004910 [Chrysochromulina tobinii]|eukprot:KOO24119.1 hypothetical protein Ctob_004910 [Chrysochromulina sp. CCMP291]